MRNVGSVSVSGTWLSSFGDAVHADSARSLELLREIESTIDSLSIIRRRFEVAADEAEMIRKKLLEADCRTIEAEEKVCSDLESAQDSLSKMHTVFCGKRDAALADRRLTDDDGVSEAFDEAIKATENLNEKLELLRWALLEHNADAEPEHSPQPLNSADDIDQFFNDL